jgi:pimeloyl-ACP methyl ester carboxylesterase
MAEMNLGPAASLRHGRGPAKVVILGGWLGVASHWAGFLEAVDPSVFEVAVFDYRGYGSRRHVPGEHTFREAAGDVLELADALGWREFSLVGHSMGGMAMQRVALAAPQRVLRLAGIAPVSAAGSPMDDARRQLFEAAATQLEARRRVIDASTGQRLAAAWCASVAQASWDAHDPAAVAGYLRAWTQQGFADEVSRLTQPVLLLVGQHDPGINMRSVAANWLQHHQRALVEEIAGAGHYPMQEAPAYTATRVQSFFSG